MILLAALAALAWFWRPLKEDAFANASFAARIGCSCRFVAGRALSECRNDVVPGMNLVMLSQDEEDRSVTARVLPFASQTAKFRSGWGCVLEPVGN